MRLLAASLLALAFAGCADILQPPPTQNPEPFPGIASQLGRFGVEISNSTSGDAGCNDPTLRPTAIRFQASGLDQTRPVQLRIYIFRSREAWDRRLPDVETCAAAWAEDPATFELVSISPYVLAGQGPWGAAFAEAARKALTEAAGNGG